VATNAASYVVSRNNSGCGFGFTPIATVSPGTTVTYPDTTASNGTTWYYNVQALGTNTDCTGPISNCVAVTPAPCTAPATPVIGAATVPGANQINVSWSQGAPASAKFNVYRGAGTCAGATFSPLTTGLAALPTNYTDGTVQGGVTYAYKVTGTDPSGSCESPQSGCVQQTATGSCTLAPTFAGLTSVSNSALAVCTTALSWSAGAKNCPLASSTITYNIYRSTTSGFSPAGANRIATGVSGTGYADSGTLADRTVYYYVVRAVDSLGNEDLNLAQQSTAPTGAVAGPTTYTSADVPKAIPDNSAAGVSSVVTVAGNPNLVTDVNVTMNVTHPRDGQLAFTLIAPTAASVALVTNRGGTNANFTNTVLDDSAATPVSAGAAPFTGTFRPESPLSAVNSLPANGVWSLHAVDGTGGQPTAGSITGWSMSITAAAVCSASACGGDTTAPVMTAQSLAKNATLDFTWTTAEIGATYTTYSTTSLPAVWTSRNTTATLSWSNPADLGIGTSYFYSTTAKDGCNNESPQ
jgi:subtilisin-like proprotein convertase family protein